MARIDLPLRHVSIRVPWHDTGWNGKVCANPKFNGSCLRLQRIADNRNDEAEQAVAGQSIQNLEKKSWPCCVTERVTFMADFPFSREINHPYVKSSPESHGHFLPTPFYHPAFSASCVPFRWMFKNTLDNFREEYDLDIDDAREPKLTFISPWIQEGSNQKGLLDCFFDHVKPDKSLCFFYAKEVPFIEDSRRVLIGVGRVKHVGEPVEYERKGEGNLRSMIWERNIQHSIRPGFIDGFILPYHEALKYAQDNPDFDISTITAFAPDDNWEEFSFATEHVSNDGAISSILELLNVMEVIKNTFEGPWGNCEKWLHDRLNELWVMRGPCPGLSSSLAAFGVQSAGLITREIESKIADNEDPWPYLEKVMKDPFQYLSDKNASKLGETILQTWSCLKPERKALLQLLSRFDITPQQATNLFVQEVREREGLAITDREMIENPYLIYETTRLSSDPVSIWKVDKGLFPDDIIRNKHPLPNPSRVSEAIDSRRIRALTIHCLENNALHGHTLVSKKDVILNIRDLNIFPSCPVTSDIMEVAHNLFKDVIEQVVFDNKSPAYQLRRFQEIGDIIRRVVNKRLSGKRHSLSCNWVSLLDGALGLVNESSGDQEIEKRARQEKKCALTELAESRFSVLNGSAGTGKTTLLSILCSQPEIKDGGVLLLAPTGKARVRMEQIAKKQNLDIRAFTVAQFLTDLGRYDCNTCRYVLSDKKNSEYAKTVIIDEASMLTEEMLGTLLDSLKGVERVILVGDPRQLPPIGAGRPFLDIISRLKSEDIENTFPKVCQGYAELTIQRRQTGSARDDLQLAGWFTGDPIPPGEDSIFHISGNSFNGKHLRVETWDTPDDLQETIIDVLCEELELKNSSDIKGFDFKLGAVESNGYRYFNRGCASYVENWQILSPVKKKIFGVKDINRLIHTRFRTDMLLFAEKSNSYRGIPKPIGTEKIVYGDKIINVANHRRKWTYPKDYPIKYVANGEIGIVTGMIKTPQNASLKPRLNIEFASQPRINYSYFPNEFKEERELLLELAYALTVHKSQGSQFGIVFVVIPENCFIMSRELLYTALTRHEDRVVLLIQGDLRDLKKYSSSIYSEASHRITNLFSAPKLVEKDNKFYESNLIHQTKNGEFVRSKSEVIIADRLADADIEYFYEQPLEIGSVTRYPDFTIKDQETGRVFYWEHCGMLGDPGYRERWEKKLAWYQDNGIFPIEEKKDGEAQLIVTEDSLSGGISSKDIQEKIISIFLD